MHVPKCLACGANEIAGKYSNEDGTGFCSEFCHYTKVRADFEDAVEGLWNRSLGDTIKMGRAFGILTAVAQSLATTARGSDVQRWTKHLNYVEK